MFVVPEVIVKAPSDPSPPKDAEVVLEQVYTEFPSLGDDDKAAIEEQLLTHERATAEIITTVTGRSYN